MRTQHRGLGFDAAGSTFGIVLLFGWVAYWPFVLMGFVTAMDDL